MLKFLKSALKTQDSAKPAPTAPARPARPVPSSKSALPPEPPPLPEVTEGNLESDWAMWEDSVAFQDSQMPSVFNDLESVKTRDEPPKKSSGHDPFAAVRRRGS